MLASDSRIIDLAPAGEARHPRQHPDAGSGRVRRREAVLAELATRRALHDRIGSRRAHLQRERETLRRNLLRM